MHVLAKLENFLRMLGNFGKYPGKCWEILGNILGNFGKYPGNQGLLPSTLGTQTGLSIYAAGVI